MVHPATPVTIAIAGPSGGGKTTLMRDVAARLGGTELYFDDYADGASYPPDLAAWLADGADPNLWRAPQMTLDLRALRDGDAVTMPNGTTLQPARFIVVEEPFGREREEIAPLIDLVVVLDVPLEIALARRIRRNFKEGRDQWDAAQILAHVDRYLANYVAFGGVLYRTINQQAMLHCDLIVDGTLAVERIGEQVEAMVRAHYPDR